MDPPEPPPGMRKLASDLVLMVGEMQASGMAKHDGPQIVVCGDQGCGKSSVLEALTEIPFPRMERLCTQFVTQVRFVPSVTDAGSITARIIPSRERANEIPAKIEEFSRQIDNFQSLQFTVSEAGAKLGLRGFFDNSETSPRFSKDVLEIEYRGPCPMAVTIVDTPGTYSPTDAQSSNDASFIKLITADYLRNPHSTILVTMRADCVLKAQIMRSIGFGHNPLGHKALGVITMPDLVTKPDGEENIASVVRGEHPDANATIGHGYFLLRNPSTKHLQNGITTEQRLKKEDNFFRTSFWGTRDLPEDRFGAEALQDYVHGLIHKHYVKQLPSIRLDLTTRLDDVRAKLRTERSTIHQKRAYLHSLASQFFLLAQSAIDGTYFARDPDFFALGQPVGDDARCLRSFVHDKNTAYARNMKEFGASRRLESQITEATPEIMPEVYQMEIVDEVEMKEFIQKAHMKGEPVPGYYNDILLKRLFLGQSKAWEPAARAHIKEVAEVIRDRFVKALFRYLIKDDHVYHAVESRVRTFLVAMKDGADVELDRLLKDEQYHPPLVYTGDYEVNVQQPREEFFRENLIKAADAAGDMNDEFHDRFMACLRAQSTKPLDDATLTKVMNDLDTYYKITEARFTENVCKQIIDRRLLRQLPRLFNAKIIDDLTDKEVEGMAAEAPGAAEERVKLRQTESDLVDALFKLNKFM